MSIQFNSELDHKKGSKYVFYIAKITGTDPKYGLSREFLKRETRTEADKITYTIEVTEPGYYELKETDNKENNVKKYLHINDDFTVEEVDYKTAKEYAANKGE